MTCHDIYIAALALIGEAKDNTGTADYAARAPHLLSVIFSRFARVSEELSGAQISRVSLNISSLSQAFPLDERLAALTSEVLASMLIIDEYPEISGMLASRADADLKMIESGIVSVTSTREVYGS